MSGHGAISAAHNQKICRSVQLFDRVRLQEWNTHAYLARHAGRAVSGRVGRRQLFTSAPTLSEIKPKLQHQHGRVKGRREERDFVLDVLSANTTKRDVKGYLKSFDDIERKKQSLSGSKNARSSDSNALHIALIKIRSLENIDDDVLIGLGQTLSQLSRLGLRCVIVLDGYSEADRKEKSLVLRQLAMDQADRFIQLLHRDTRLYACRIHNALGVTSSTEPPDKHGAKAKAVEVQYSDMILKPLRRGMIPIIPPLGYTTDTQTPVDLDAKDVVLALARQFAGLRPSSPTQGPAGQFQLSQEPDSVPDRHSVDRIILLDPLGGLPSLTRPDHAHIFVNMEQEYSEIHSELSTPGLDGKIHEAHIRNLDLLNDVLTLLPPSSSAMITTPQEAAIRKETSLEYHGSHGGGGVRTRRPRNPLLFNLLTDKPLISSSLPAARMNPVDPTSGSLKLLRSGTGGTSPATFLKRGMPVTMVPDPRTTSWTPPPVPGSDDSSIPASIDLRNDPRIDFPRLLNLIEDSFGRPLDVEDYLSRVDGRVAGVIIAGAYDGGAILTWELPSGLSGSDPSARSRMVPYLDKFAVLKRSQGAGGVADIVFSAMVRTCFPNGVCWRSRKTNPVNKWYFERSVGTLKLPDSMWTMFWTTPGLESAMDGQQFRDYEAVCRSVQPSWADTKTKPD